MGLQSMQTHLLEGIREEQPSRRPSELGPRPMPTSTGRSLGCSSARSCHVECLWGVRLCVCQRAAEELPNSRKTSSTWLRTESVAYGPRRVEGHQKSENAFVIHHQNLHNCNLLPTHMNNEHITLQCTTNGHHCVPGERRHRSATSTIIQSSIPSIAHIQIS